MIHGILDGISLVWHEMIYFREAGECLYYEGQRRLRQARSQASLFLVSTHNLLGTFEEWLTHYRVRQT